MVQPTEAHLAFRMRRLDPYDHLEFEPYSGNDEHAHRQATRFDSEQENSHEKPDYPAEKWYESGFALDFDAHWSIGTSRVQCHSRRFEALVM